MFSSQKKILLFLYKSNQTVFRLKDIALFAGETNFQSLNKRVNYLVKKEELLSIRKGIYALPEYKNEELASKIFTPSYLSIDYILQKEGVIFQYDSAFTSVSYLSRTIEIQESVFSYRKIKNEVLTNTTGIYITNYGTFVANAERAFLVHIPLKTDTCSVSKRTLFLKIKRTLFQKNIGVKLKKFKNNFLKFFSLIYLAIVKGSPYLNTNL